MFSTSFAGKAGSAVLSYEGGEFVAVITGGKAVKSSDMMDVFRALRPALGDRGAMLAMRSFVRNMGMALRVMSGQRRAFLHASKPIFVKIRKVARAGKKAKRPVSKK